MSRPEVYKATMKALAPLRAENGRRNITRYNKSEKHRKVASEIGKRTVKYAVAARRRNDVTMEEVISLRTAGMTNPMIAERLKCSVSLVERRVQAAKKKDMAVPPSPYDPGKMAKIVLGKPGNHKVVSVERGGEADVYDLTVDETHNFALDSGVFVHNSKDLADAMSGVVYWITENKRPGLILAPSTGLSSADSSRSGWADGDYMWGDEEAAPPPPADDDQGYSSWLVT